MEAKGKRRAFASSGRRPGGVYKDRREVINVYVNGSSALMPEPEPAPLRDVQLSAQAIANRERSLQMNIGYVVFLTLSAVITVLICVNYLKLQAGYTTLQKEATSLEVRLSDLKLDNDAEYNRIMTGVDMEAVKDRAMNYLGMVYASSDQVVTYDPQDHDYVKQYREIPSE